MTKLGRDNSCDIDEQFYKVSEFHHNHVLFAFKPTSLDNLTNNSGKNFRFI